MSDNFKPEPTLEGSLVYLNDVVARKRSQAIVEANAVKLCRDKGATWSQIGEVYGVSRQAAFQKWGKSGK